MFGDMQPFDSHCVSAGKQKRLAKLASLFVIPKRFERLTHALEGRCSIQLSYGTYLYGNGFPFPSAKIACLFLYSKDFLSFL